MSQSLFYEYKQTILYFAVVFLFSYCSPNFASETVQPWATYGGFYVGMTKSAAKAAGYGACAFGTDFVESKESVYCEIPPAKRTLTNLNVTYAKLRFKPPKLEEVNEIVVRVKAGYLDVNHAITAQYGPPLPDLGIWNRDSPHTISVLRSRVGISSTITFGFDPSLSKRLKRYIENEKMHKKNRSQTLDSF